MSNIKYGTTKRIYWFIIILSIIIGYVFYGALKDQFGLPLGV